MPRRNGIIRLVGIALVLAVAILTLVVVTHHLGIVLLLVVVDGCVPFTGQSTHPLSCRSLQSKPRRINRARYCGQASGAV